MANALVGTNILAIQDLDEQDLSLILEQAEELEAALGGGGESDLLAGRALVPLFYEAAPWLRSSLESAMLRLGGRVLSMSDLTDASAVRGGHALARSARIASAYADIIVHRHPEVYSAHEAAKGARVPLINAGDGTYEQPLQALADLYTLRKEKGEIDGLSIAIVGDLRHSPAVHSLTRALAHWHVTLTLVSPANLKMATALTVPLKRALTVVETADLGSVAEDCDVLYVTSMGARQLAKSIDAGKMKESYRIDRRFLQRFGDDITVLHPLPLGEEIAADVDVLPGAAYFRHVADGIWVQMAVLALLLGAL